MGTDHLEKMLNYIGALEEERRKILVFQRELPLCLELVNEAIGACKQQLSTAGVGECNNNGGNVQSECSEQTSTEGTPVLEEFIPMKGLSRSEEGEDDEDDEDRYSHKQMKINNDNDGDKEKSSSVDSKKKSDWLKSAQLWNQSPDPPPKEEHQPPRKVSVVEVKRNGGAFQPFCRDQKYPEKSHQSSEKQRSSPETAATSSSTGVATVGRRGEKEGQAHTQRKQRRCWSPDLHRSFLQALQELGGSHAATPKQIRELMKVDGLTNDEVKSHLQKFRLYNRRPSPTIHNSSGSQPPQIVVVGGIWVPPPEYAATTATKTAKATAANGIQGPVGGALPPTAAAPEENPTRNPESEVRGSHSSRSSSSPSSTSSSSHTITASPSY